MRRAIIAALIALAAVILYRFPPDRYSFYPRCWLLALTGLQCPGCGATRAAHQLLHGNVAEAFALNPMLFVLIGVAAAMLPGFVRGELPRFVSRPWFGWTSATVLVAFWIGRNI